MGFERSFLHLMRSIFGIDARTNESSTIPTGEEAMHLRQSCGAHRADKVEISLGGAWVKTSGKNPFAARGWTGRSRRPVVG